MDTSITFYSTGIPHSVSIPMEELFEKRWHHLPTEMQEYLSELPAFSIYVAKSSVRRREVFAYDDRLTFIELERFLY